ncbi:DUF4862 family protein [Jiangella gansuensis]|uniref:DUF4862 family protein n=1 Tax=Jiangella gansuensis TaxID=281473 RepID=UPI0004B143D3|nr:DUF4862 family protein [Jiangella gansuensis]
MSVIVGAYAAAPRDIGTGAAFRRYVDDVLGLPDVVGLEVPFAPAGSPWNDPAYLHASGPSTQHVLTMIPATMAALGSAPSTGLASADDDGRRAALDLLRRAWEFVREVNEGPGGRFTGVELHSAPRAPHTSAGALRDSLAEAAGWDWGGVRLMIEHSDAHSDTHEPAKGFLELDDELAIATDLGLGVVVNWGRSAIEGRDDATPRKHLAAAVAAGRLDGLMFSGASAADTLDGPAWADLHLPVRDWSDTVPIAREAASSLLTKDEVAACVSAAAAAAGLRYVGVKVSSPSTASSAECLELVRANAAIVASAVAGARG